MNAKNFCKKFADDEIILVGNDIGPFRCFESIGADFPQNEIFIHVQGKELRDYIERTEINFPLTEISALRLLMMIIVRRRRSIFILQSSYVTPLEKILNKLHANIYVIQDFRNDFKSGKLSNMLRLSNRYQTRCPMTFQLYFIFLKAEDINVD